MAKHLTPQEELFAVEVVRTGNKTGAHHTAYPKSKKWKSNAASVQAQRLCKKPKVAARIDELREEAREAAKLTLKEHMDELASLRDEAVGCRQLSAAVKAEQCRGQASGLYVEKKELTGKDGNPLLAVPEVIYVEAGDGTEPDDGGED